MTDLTVDNATWVALVSTIINARVVVNGVMECIFVGIKGAQVMGAPMQVTK